MTYNNGCMEFLAYAPEISFENIDLKDLLEAVENSAIHTFGWPIALVIRNNKEKGKLAPTADGNGMEFRWNEKNSQEYWSVNRSGEFYFKGELFENERKPTHVFLDTRTNRVTETLLRIQRYYKLLKVYGDQKITILISHQNIKGRILGFANPYKIPFSDEIKSNSNEAKTMLSLTLAEIEEPESLKCAVYKVICDLTEKFDFYRPEKKILDLIVEDFLQGRIR